MSILATKRNAEVGVFRGSLKSVPHIAFEVDDIDRELARHNFEIISEPSSNSDEIRVAMILHNGAPVELIEFKKNK